MNTGSYVHGYSEIEKTRLSDQAGTLSELLHFDSIFSPGGVILEAGCGTGEQTKIISKKNPGSSFLSIDISSYSLEIARQQIRENNISNVEFQLASIFDLPFRDESFDHVFVCFVLEHLSNTLEALKSLKRVLKKNGTITVIEGDHGSAYYYPQSEFAQATIQCLIEIQASAGGNSLIGRQLYPLLNQAGFKKCKVSPRMVYADQSKPVLVDGFTRKTFNAMVEGVKHRAITGDFITPEAWERGITDLYKTAEKDGTFCYTFFKATAIK
jgi:ubiquinone/menaquinone biosynthesis C-methylase UbiE